MSKVKYIVRCQACGCTAPKWLGRCPDCGEWNTMDEEPLESGSSRSGNPGKKLDDVKPITEISIEKETRLSTGYSELDRVLGGGVVKGSLVLIGGEPGIGKSTLLLQTAYRLADSAGKVLIVSGEESTGQISIRAKRLGANSDNLLVLSEVDVTSIDRYVRDIMPGLLVIDSIQTMFHPDLPSAPGSVSQVRECTHYLMRLAKGIDIPTFIVGHVTKDGAIAGPRVLEHMVDTVLYFEGDNYQTFRIVRAVKNRFGSTNEIGIFEMTDAGLVEVTNPSALFLNQKPIGSSGSTVIATIEGTRPLLVELQSLVTTSYLSMPVKVNEPAADLGIALAVASAHRDIAIPADMIAIGEIGLSGEVRHIGQLETRIKEAVKLGFSRAIIPDQDLRTLNDSVIKGMGMELLKAKNLAQAIDYIS
ncbi:MAG: DNA repair protein RadA [Rubrobacteridae bacterium]|nr:DNA repair protein RadA [Rubrobacteridae bacterium]